MSEILPAGAGADSAVITDCDVERARRQIGVPKFAYNKPYNLWASADSIRHFAFGCGDDNPLWHDPAYGASTRWRSQIAPPLFLHSTGSNLTPKPDADTKALFKGLFRGVGKYYSGVDWTWWRPVFPDDLLYTQRITSDVVVKERSGFSGKRTVTEVYSDIWVDHAASPVGLREEHYLSAERGGTRSVGRDAKIERQSYTADDIARIDDIYAAEQRRGAEPRFWEDVEVGDALTPVAKGPLTMVDIIAQHMGLGLSSSGIGPLRYNWAQRQKMPAFFVPDRFGVPDVVQRVHWDHERAQALGLPTSYDYGQMRTSWLIHLVTNWMGDDAWLWSLSCQSRAFNYMGDVTVCSGKVKDKRRDGPHCVVDLEIEGVNQRGQVTCPGRATVILPSREDGPVILPTPGLAYRQRAARVVSAI